MNVVRYSDHCSPIGYVLASRECPTGEVEIVLELYRGSALASRTVLAKVAARDERTVTVRCRRHLQRQGIEAALGVPPPRLDLAGSLDPRHSLPVAAFDWMFEAG